MAVNQSITSYASSRGQACSRGMVSTVASTLLAVVAPANEAADRGKIGVRGLVASQAVTGDFGSLSAVARGLAASTDILIDASALVGFVDGVKPVPDLPPTSPSGICKSAVHAFACTIHLLCISVKCLVKMR